MGADCTIVIVERRPTAVIRAEAVFAELPQVQRAARAKLGALLPSLDAGPLGAAFGRPFAARDGVLPSDLPAGRAAHLTMKGGFENLPLAWQTLFDWCKAENHAPAGINWEIYGATEGAELYALLAYD